MSSLTTITALAAKEGSISPFLYGYNRQLYSEQLFVIFVKMKRIVILLIAFFAIWLFTACSSTYYALPSVKNTDDFKGMSYKQIVSMYGAPTQNVPDGEGGFILVYVGNHSLFNYSNAYARAARQLPTAQFFMSADGICESVRYDYNPSVSEYNPAATAGLLFLLR